MHVTLIWCLDSLVVYTDDDYSELLDSMILCTVSNLLVDAECQLLLFVSTNM